MSNAIDLQHLRKYVGDDVHLRDEVLAIFVEHAAPLLDRLDPDADDGSWRDAAHTLKGGARGIGAWAVGDLCEAAENLVGSASEKAENRRALLGKLHGLVEEVIHETRRLHEEAA